MIHAHFDCPSGAAGDMILGALVDAGVPFRALESELAKLRLTGYSLECRAVTKAGFRATKVDVKLKDDARSHPAHRSLREILEILERSDVAAVVKERATRIFTRLGQAEARAHGTSLEAVQFHDVGAIDAIVDVTGACVGLHLLAVDSLSCGPLPLGGGFVEGPHGRMPVPGPATAELVKGFPLVDTGVRRELVTPTGAAILTTLASASGHMPPITVTAVGCGAGTMELDTPNIVRVFLGEKTEQPRTETICQVETTVDDMSPQLYEPLMERLFDAGALDVYLTPVLMKKSRPGVVVTALCEPDAVGALTRVCFTESTTIGVRWTEYRRQRLPREIVTLQTSLGPLAYKVSSLDGRVVTVTPEFDDVKRVARDKGMAVREALELARAEGRRLVN